MEETTDIESIELRNEGGDSAVILTYGAIVAEFNINTAHEDSINVVLGYPHPQTYRKDAAYHGAIAGRYCNRIANSCFSLGKEHYSVTANEGAHHLHGGPDGFNRRLWRVEQRTISSVTLSLFSEDGDQGYPGNLTVQLRYELKDAGCLDITWEARCDQNTVVSLTSHCYFNLAGLGDIRNHFLRIPIDQFTPMTPDMIPTGEIQKVDGSSLDLRKLTKLEKILTSTDKDITRLGGLDHNWARESAGTMALSAELLCPDSGLLMQVSSTLPGLQCYTGNGLAANGIHGCHEGVCLEPQYYPNSPNEASFPSPLLRAGEVMRHALRYQVTAVEAETVLNKK